MDVVFQVLAGLASQLTEDGDSTPIGNSSASQRITIEDFLRTPTPSSKVRGFSVRSSLRSR
jgi:hypothetical protein